MYDLFILGKLLDQPVHGYLLHQIISVAIGPTRQLSWGALYPLIRRLEQDGLIAPEAAHAGATGHRRKLYRITGEGVRRFHMMMRDDGEYDADYPDRFTIKLANFRHIDAAAQLAILQQYRRYLQFTIDYLRERQRRVDVAAEIREAARPHIHQVLERRLYLTGADLIWIDREIGKRRELAGVRSPQNT